MSLAVFLQYLFPKRALTEFGGWVANGRWGAITQWIIRRFIRRYGVNMAEAANPEPTAYACFNEFFTRALKPSARPITEPENPRLAVFPADGRHLAFADVSTAPGFYVKGATFSLEQLLGGPELAAEFAGGSMLISRLCPVDYHRFHFPVAGTPDDGRLIGGWLYSVSPIALRRNVQDLAQNKRRLTLIDSPEFGRVAMLEVGATNVGSIVETYVTGRPVRKGEEKGLFKFGGSCVITVFARGRIRFDADVLEQSSQFRETYARMGDRLGSAP